MFLFVVVVVLYIVLTYSITTECKACYYTRVFFVLPLSITLLYACGILCGLDCVVPFLCVYVYVYLFVSVI